jgi:hypothetical protein
MSGDVTSEVSRTNLEGVLSGLTIRQLGWLFVLIRVNRRLRRLIRHQAHLSFSHQATRA